MKFLSGRSQMRPWSAHLGKELITPDHYYVVRWTPSSPRTRLHPELQSKYQTAGIGSCQYSSSPVLVIRALLPLVPDSARSAHMSDGLGEVGIATYSMLRRSSSERRRDLCEWWCGRGAPREASLSRWSAISKRRFIPSQSFYQSSLHSRSSKAVSDLLSFGSPNLIDRSSSTSQKCSAAM